MVDKRSLSSPDSEKITINLGHVDLGQIDLLVDEGFYSNRSDFIRTAIRNRLDRHTDAVKSRSPGATSISVFATTIERNLRQSGRRANRFTSRFSAWR